MRIGMFLFIHSALCFIINGPRFVISRFVAGSILDGHILISHLLIVNGGYFHRSVLNKCYDSDDSFLNQCSVTDCCENEGYYYTPIRDFLAKRRHRGDEPGRLILDQTELSKGNVNFIPR